MPISSPIIDIHDFLQLTSNPSLIILDATIDKVDQKLDKTILQLIPNSIFFDIEGNFSVHNSSLPHTMLTREDFEQEARNLGINNNSILIIYDQWGLYSSPRAWWMFRYMGHKEVYVLNGGIEAWINQGLPVKTDYITPTEKGNFIAKTDNNWFESTYSLLKKLTSPHITVTDARNKGRFNGTVPEPRKGLRSGHIPSSTNLPFDQLMNGAFIKPVQELEKIYVGHSEQNKHNIFSCGSGITASILALGAYQVGHTDIAVYDGSWSEWGADSNLPIE
ncbi:sulfurtransferase [Sphingobacterium pedocola]|uniref:Sulfurtransferase n=1 Tax=Sphingobacterium pedocola TaxID=2082722 RepID=A0ABR9T2J6_9SPHI|nr:sulfurtransferase [Sphingobacterium pedocola]MBE8719500.1 sulfurtransferase [Sphingobacterium pedocola]